MIRFSRGAVRQIDDLVEHFIRLNRSDAVFNLDADLVRAKELIESGGGTPASYPRPYPNLRHAGFLWIRVRAYWIAWRVIDDVAIIANVFHVSADITGRMSLDTEEADWP